MSFSRLDCLLLSRFRVYGVSNLSEYIKSIYELQLSSHSIWTMQSQINDQGHFSYAPGFLHCVPLLSTVSTLFSVASDFRMLIASLLARPYEPWLWSCQWDDT